MRYYSFAGLNVSISGMENANYFCGRLSSYETAPSKHSDITVLHSEPYHIREPEGCTIAQNGLRRLFVTPDGGYKIYDFLPDLSGLMACITADREWKSITTQLLDTVAIGGSPNDLRCFNMMGDLIRHALLMHGGMMLHASAISYNGQGVAFSAPSGTGKSTHTGLWKKAYHKEVDIINDDSPAIRFSPGGAVISGLPWSGTSGVNQNISVPLAAVVCLERGENNHIVRLGSKTAVSKVLSETPKPFFPEMIQALLERTQQLIQSVPFYLLTCNMTAEAVETVKNTIF